MPEIGRCKICGYVIGAAEEVDEEHIFADAIGGTIVLYPVHKQKCNSPLGTSVESALVDHQLIQIKRSLLGVESRSGPARPLKNVKFQDQHGNRWTHDPVAGFEQARKIFRTGNQVRIESQNDPDRSKLIRTVQDFLRSEGLGEMSAETIVSSAVHTEEQRILNGPLQFDKMSYLRGLIKIAYEMTVYWLGDRYLCDGLAKRFCKCLFDKNSPDRWIRYRLHGHAGPIDPAQEYFWTHLKEPAENHLAILMRIKHYLVCYVRVFDVFQASVCVSDRAGLYPLREGEGFFLSLDPKTGKYQDLRLHEYFGLSAPEHQSDHSNDQFVLMGVPPCNMPRT